MDDENEVESQDLQETTEETTTSQETVEQEEDLQAIREAAAKVPELESKNKQLFERAKKAEGFVLVDGKWVKPAKETTSTETANELSSKDILALSSAGITEEEDIEILQKAAKLNGTSIAKAIKDPVVAGILKGKQEERQTAAASSTSSTRRAQNERTGRDLLNNAQKGQLPESKDGIRKLVRARIGVDK